MTLKTIKINISLLIILALATIALGNTDPLDLRNNPFESAIVIAPTDTIPLKDRTGNFLLNKSKNPFDLKDPSIIDQTVEYDPVTNQYIITEKMGDEYFRSPTYMTFDEYVKWKSKKQEKDYFDALAGIGDPDKNSSIKIDPLARFKIKKSLVDRLFGSNKIDIKPQGNVDITFGGFYTINENPLVATHSQKRGGFNFDQDIRMSVTGKIGEKLNLNANFNTGGGNFDFNDIFKLAYDGEAFGEDDIVQNVEAGNVSLPLKSSLIQGSQSLFGLKAELKFGHLNITALASQQKSKQGNIKIESGAVEQKFEVRPDAYDENRHFFLSFYHRNSYENSLRALPEVSSLIQIKRIEVWLTDNNTANSQPDFRDIVALADLGTADYTQFHKADGSLAHATDPRKDLYGLPLPRNEANKLFANVTSNLNSRQRSEVVNFLQDDQELVQTRDFEKVRARKLSSSEFSYNAQLGFISLNVRPKPDQIVAVSYEYSYRGSIFRVGEFASDLPSDSSYNVLYTKMLKSSAQNTKLPSWDLMMKNIYPLGTYGLTNEDFRLDIYYEARDGKSKRYLEELDGYPLINFFKLDNLNATGDPQPDGTFDYIPGLTILPRIGSIIFPVLEPFGSSFVKLLKNFNLSPAKEKELTDKYVYQELYDNTITAARQSLEKNKFFLAGRYKSSSSSDISLGAFNIPRGSIRVTAGGKVLTEANGDISIDYNIGRVKILNEQYLQPGIPINISFEDNTLFGFQQKTMLGLRADYSIGKDMNVGATYLHLFEQPYTTKVNLGDDPINNKIFGVDFNVSKETPWLTRWVDKIPLIDTKEKSQIAFQAEAAAIKPGHSKAINQGDEDGGAIYLDDFEGASSPILLTYPVSKWILSSIPQGQKSLFPEADLSDDLASGANRAKLAWYSIELGSAGNNQNNSYTRTIAQDELFPQKSRLNTYAIANQRLFDVTYFPDEKGPYNFELPDGYPSFSKGLTPDNRLIDPDTRWAGIMRDLSTNDFEEANVEYIEFWMMNPYMNKEDGSPVSENGILQIHLGTMSEDIFKDSRQQFENGLPTTDQDLPTEITNWGRIARRPPLVSNSFDNDRREEQDVGFDGLDDIGETKQFSNYLKTMRGHLNAKAYADEVSLDPSSDNFVHFQDEEVNGQTSIQRYKNFNNPQGNARPSSAGQQGAVRSYTNFPDKEDLNEDESLNESENYFIYKIPLRKDGTGLALDEIATPYITDTRTTESNSLNTEKWYRFRIPIQDFAGVSGQIQNFRSIQFMRIIFKDFSQRTTFRFAKLELIRNQWRKYSADDCQGVTDPNGLPQMNLDVANIEESENRKPFKYIVPKSITRERIQGAYADQLQNEQSLVMDIRQISDSCERSIFKLLDVDIRNFEKIKMFVHAHELDDNNPIIDGDLSIFMQMGSDFEDNYYEYEIPLKMSDRAFADIAKSEDIWLEGNEFNFPFSLFTDLKVKRNTSGFSVNELFIKGDPDNGENTIKIIGNPTFGFVKGVRIGIRNTNKDVGNKDVEVWINELRMTGLNERGGVAALARLDIQLADFGTMTAAGAYTGIGFGGLDQKLAQRSQEEVIQYDLSTNLKLDKFFPKKWGVSLPLYAQYSKSISTPLYDPIDTDLKLKDKINRATGSNKDSIRSQAVDNVRVRAFNFTNVRKQSNRKKGKPKPWDISNFSASYAYSDTKKTDPILENDEVKSQIASLDYDYSIKAPYIMPFKKIVKSKHLKFIKEINFNLLPNSFSFTNSMDRQRATRTYRFQDPRSSTWQSNRFNWDRDYNLKWDVMKSLKVNLSATNLGTVDEILYNPLRRGFVNPVTNTIVDEGETRPFLTDNIKNFGRTKSYSHKASASYTLPFRNIPLLSWITAKANYNANYKWTAGSLRTVDSLGSIIQNGQDIQLTMDLNFKKLYNKSKYLKEIYRRPRSSSRKKSKSRNKKTASNKKKSTKKNRKNKKRKITMGERIAIRPLLLLKSAKFSYSETRETVLPGFMNDPNLLGMGESFTSPGWDFVAGIQPRLGTVNRPGWLDEIANKGWISNSVFLSQEVLQIRNRKATAKVTLEPFYDFKIDLNVSWDKTFQLSEQFMDTLGVANDFQFNHLTPYESGSYKISYISFQTLFSKVDNLDELFSNLEAFRPRISQRVAAKYNVTSPHDIGKLDTLGYLKGFGPNHNEVLMPSFIAAYTNKSPDDVSLNLFDIIPLPNWQLTYNGLSKIGIFQDIFKNFSLKHGYKSTMTINSFNTNYQFAENSSGRPINQIEQTKSFYPRYRIPAVVITEAFSPLLGIKFETDNAFSFSVEMKKSRNLALELDHSKLNESLTTDYTLGVGYVVKDFDIRTFGFKSKKKKKKKKKKKSKSAQNAALKNLFGGGDSQEGRNLELDFEFSYKDNLSQAYSLNEGGISEAFRGSTDISILPSARYLFSDRLSFRLFFEYRKTIPHVSRQFGRTTYDGGITIQFTLK